MRKKELSRRLTELERKVIDLRTQLKDCFIDIAGQLASLKDHVAKTFPSSEEALDRIATLEKRFERLFSSAYRGGDEMVRMQDRIAHLEWKTKDLPKELAKFYDLSGGLSRLESHVAKLREETSP